MTDNFFLRVSGGMFEIWKKGEYDQFPYMLSSHFSVDEALRAANLSLNYPLMIPLMVVP